MVFLSGVTGGFDYTQGFVLKKIILLVFGYIVWMCVFSRTAVLKHWSLDFSWEWAMSEDIVVAAWVSLPKSSSSPVM